MEPTILNTPRIYNGEGIYKTGAGADFNYETVTVDGQEYKTLNYNSRLWTVENLRNNIGSNVDVVGFGRFYGYYNTKTPLESLLSDGWRIPSKNDFLELINFLSEYDTLDWISTDCGGTNKTGFNMPLIGYYTQNGLLNYGKTGYIWSSTAYDSTKNWNLNIRSDRITAEDSSDVQPNSATKCCFRICKDV